LLAQNEVMEMIQTGFGDVSDDGDEMIEQTTDFDRTSVPEFTTGIPPEVTTTELYFVMCFLSVLAVVGSIGNVVVLYVFGMKKEKLTANVFIIALASVDLITCLIVIPSTVFMEYVNFHVSSDAGCKLYMFLITCNIPFSAFIMVAIAVDRYLCICHPFLHLMTVGRAKVLTACLALCAASLGICVSLFHGVYARNTFAFGNATTNATAAGAAEVAAEGEGDWTTMTSPNVNAERFPAEGDLVNIGYCRINGLIVSMDIQFYYQKLYTFMYPTCLVVVVILYVVIYSSVRRRRSMRQQQKSKSLAMVKLLQPDPTQAATSRSTPVGGQDLAVAVDAAGASPAQMQTSQLTLKPPLTVRTSYDNCTTTTEVNGCHDGKKSTSEKKNDSQV
jgi:hypothetical protein